MALLWVIITMVVVFLLSEPVSPKWKNGLTRLGSIGLLTILIGCSGEEKNPIPTPVSTSTYDKELEDDNSPLIKSLKKTLKDCHTKALKTDPTAGGKWFVTFINQITTAAADGTTSKLVRYRPLDGSNAEIESCMTDYIQRLDIPEGQTKYRFSIMFKSLVPKNTSKSSNPLKRVPFSKAIRIAESCCRTNNGSWSPLDERCVGGDSSATATCISPGNFILVYETTNNIDVVNGRDFIR